MQQGRLRPGLQLSVVRQEIPDWLLLRYVSSSFIVLYELLLIVISVVATTSVSAPTTRSRELRGGGFAGVLKNRKASYHTCTRYVIL